METDSVPETLYFLVTSNYGRWQKFGNSDFHFYTPSSEPFEFLLFTSGGEWRKEVMVCNLRSFTKNCSEYPTKKELQTDHAICTTAEETCIGRLQLKVQTYRLT
jgi:hypothetical protein